MNSKSSRLTKECNLLSNFKLLDQKYTVRHTGGAVSLNTTRKLYTFYSRSYMFCDNLSKGVGAEER